VSETIWSHPQRDSRFVAAGGARLHYKRDGSGLPVLLIHGSASSLHHFTEVARALSGAFDVIRLDLPGFGLTGPRADRDYRLETYARSVADFLSALGVARCAIVGNSFGGNVAWNVALLSPERVTALVLINATGYPEKTLPAGLRLARSPLLRPLMRRWMPRALIERGLRAAVGARKDLVDAAMVDRAYALMNRPGNCEAFIDLANTDQTDRSAEIRRISAPTLVLRSAKIDGQHFTRDIAGAEDRVHATAGHLLAEEDPAWVSAAIDGFLRSRVAREGAPS
jgi:pimeloyl-ACP methyl ester carboxylesterase